MDASRPPRRHPTVSSPPPSSPATPPKQQQPPTLYRPLIYHYKCRGALHSSSSSSPEHDLSHNSSSGGGGVGGPPSPGAGLPLCHGLESKLRHVQTLPTVQSKDDAVSMFQDVVGSKRYAAVGGLDEEDGEDYANRAQTQLGRAGRGGGGKGSGGVGGSGGGGEAPEKAYVSCYGSTDVNVLMVDEIDPATAVGAENGMFPFGGPFGGPLGDMNPLDPFAIFGGAVGPNGRGGGGGGGGEEGREQQDLFGPGGFGDLFGIPGGGGFGGGSSGSTMRSVSSSTRTTSDGKRVTTKSTTTVDPGGKRTTRVETTVRNVDGTVEHSVTGGNGDDGVDNGVVQSSPNGKPNGEPDPLGRWAHMAHMPTTSQPTPFWERPKAPQVLAILPECKLGITVSTVEDTKAKRADTVMAVRVGPVEVAVGDTYDILDDEEEAMEVEAAARDNGVKGNGEGGEKQGDRGAGRRPGGSILDPMSNLSQDKVRTTLEKTAASMKKNADTIRNELSDDFPARVVRSGEKIVGNFGRTLERSRKVAGDLWRMWSEEDDE